jgi:hypothetical protein
MLGIPLLFHIRKLTVEYLSVIIAIKEGTSMGRSSTDPWMESSPRAFMERERS